MSFLRIVICKECLTSISEFFRKQKNQFGYTLVIFMDFETKLFLLSDILFYV